MTKGNKYISFSFSLPLPNISKEKGRTIITSAGELLVCARARVAASLGELPLEFEDKAKGEVKIVIESVHYNGVDILPVLGLPEAKGLRESIDKAAHTNLLHIKNYE